jgi:hypothetical protein
MIVNDLYQLVDNFLNESALCEFQPTCLNFAENLMRLPCSINCSYNIFLYFCASKI